MIDNRWVKHGKSNNDQRCKWTEYTKLGAKFERTGELRAAYSIAIDDII